MINFSAKTDKGSVRENNQDYFLCGKLIDGAVYLIVCDGMGGRNGGEIASEATSEIVKLSINRGYAKDMNDTQIKDLLVMAIKSANLVVYNKACEEPQLQGMGTTTVAAIIRDEMAYIAHVGDSRAYHVTLQDVTQITKDHTMVQMLIDTGNITQKEADQHPQKHLITRAVGVDKNIDIDFNQVTFYEDDVLLLCTDGLSNHLTSDDIYSIVKHSFDYETLPQRLVDLANQRGGTDNVTVAVAY